MKPNCDIVPNFYFLYYVLIVFFIFKQKPLNIPIFHFNRNDKNWPICGNNLGLEFFETFGN